MENDLEKRAYSPARIRQQKKKKLLFGNLIGNKATSHRAIKNSYDDFGYNYQESDSLDRTTSRLPQELFESKNM